jgi:hypothetical protein
MIGVIRVRAGGSALTYDGWCDLVRSRPELVPGKLVQGRNPFTRGPRTYHPPPDAASIVIDGRVVGHTHWSLSGEDEVIVSGDADALAPLAHDLAAALGAEFEKWPEK